MSFAICRLSPGRSPQGECGLKYQGFALSVEVDCRSPQGECGLKYIGVHERFRRFAGRSPQGECGLKFDEFGQFLGFRVAPRKGSVD